MRTDALAPTSADGVKAMRLTAWLAVCATALVLPGAAMAAKSAPDRGRAFEPVPLSKPLYGIQEPSADPGRQRTHVRAGDGTRLFVETWLPAPRDGRAPPARVPTVLVITPYATIGAPRYEEEGVIQALVPYGYAYAQMHVRGTGESGGCLEFISRQETDDAARVLRYIGRDAEWSTGNVAAIGLSYDGGSVVALAGAPHPWVAAHLKAIVSLAPAATFYDLGYFDGVPYAAYDPGGAAALTALFSLPPGTQGPAEQHLQRTECQPRVLMGSLNADGNFTDFAREREYRDDAEGITAATMMVHGLADGANPPLVQAGLFDRLPRTTPKTGLFGVFWHEWPHHHVTPVRPEWERADFLEMVRAWLDRYLIGLPTGVERWPAVQVQGSDGQWRAEPDWPRTGDPPGELALSSGGSLGSTRPSGTSTFREGAPEVAGTLAAGTFARFSTPRLPGRLELTGQPMLRLWVSLDRPDAHLAARIDALDRNGDPIPYASTVGFRSMQHLDPLQHGRFVQAQPRPAPIGTPIAVELRFNPTDIVVPEGGRLQLTVAGSLEGVDPVMLATSQDLPLKDPSQPSGAGATVTILHDCLHPSALRFTYPREDASLLNVREPDEPAGEPLTDQPRSRVQRSDGGGVATARICSTGRQGLL